jgi:hypothetical protein
LFDPLPNPPFSREGARRHCGNDLDLKLVAVLALLLACLLLAAALPFFFLLLALLPLLLGLGNQFA